MNNKRVKKDRVNIWPLSLGYIIMGLIISGGFILLMNVGPILIVIFEDSQINFFGKKLHNAWFLVFALPVAAIADYMYLKAVLWRVSFTNTHIFIPKIPEIQENDLKIPCDEILTCEVTMEGFYYFFTFTLDNGKKRKMFITRFSFRQMEMILKMIQERGGLIDQNINEIINPLRIRRKKQE